jgi:hypothetical protein
MDEKPPTISSGGHASSQCGPVAQADRKAIFPGTPLMPPASHSAVTYRLGYRWQDVLWVVVLGISLNVAGNALTPILNGLMFLDTLGTVLAAFAIGPWWGALVGLVTNLILAEWPGKEQYFNYAIVNVVAGLFWGYVARTRLNPFPPSNSPRRLFLSMLAAGALGGLLCSLTAGFTRLRFAWHVTPEFLDTLPDRHATDRIAKWALGSSSPFSGIAPALLIVPLDAVSVIPDKVVSTAFAAFTLYYFLPSLRRQLTKTTGKRQSRWPIPEVVFLCAYLYPLVRIVIWGSINVDPTGQLSWQRIPAQICLWLVPFLLALWTIAWRLCLKPQPTPVHSPLDNNSALRVDDAYKDALSVVTVVYTLLLAAGSPYADQHIISLTRDGIGVLSFFGIFAVLPIVVAKYFSREYQGTPPRVVASK